MKLCIKLSRKGKGVAEIAVVIKALMVFGVGMPFIENRLGDLSCGNAVPVEFELKVEALAILNKLSVGFDR